MGKKHTLFILNPVLTVFVALCFCVPSSSADDSQSHEKYWLAHPYYYWIGPAGQNASSIEPVRGDTPIPSGEYELHDYNGSIHVRFPLQDGLNALSLRRTGEPFWTADIFYAPAYRSSQVPRGYKRYLFHVPERERRCASCHRTEPEESDKSPRPYTASICYSCHKGIVEEKKWVHGPAGAWICFGCHEIEGKRLAKTDKPVRYSIKEKRSALLCFKCHIEAAQKISGSCYIHGPVGAGACEACHDPHASDYKYQLHQDGNRICVACHEDIGELLKLPYVHPIIKKEGCTACHDPHAGDYSRQLGNRLLPLCFQCHPGIKNEVGRHPVSGHPVTGPRDPSKKKGRLTCVSCHNPHAAVGRHLLSDENPMEICIKCHNYQEQRKVPSIDTGF